MRILILPDLLNNWALHNRAKAIKKYLPEHDIEIRAGLRNLISLVDHEDFDVIHFNFTYGITDMYDFIMRNKNRCFITVVNERSLLAGYGVNKELLERILSSCPYVNSVSKTVADMLGCPFVPNGIDEDLFNSYKKPVIGYAGTEKNNKNVKSVIEACRDLGVEIRVAGYNNGSPTYKHEEMKNFYCGLDVYVHASLTEGFNNTVIEALSCNVPVLMTKEGSWQEFEGYVDFIDPTVEGIKHGLNKFLGRKLVLEKYTWNNIVPKYEDFYRLIHENNHRVQQQANA